MRCGVESNVCLVTAAANSIYSEVSAQTHDKVEDVTSCNSYARLFRSLSLLVSLYSILTPSWFRFLPVNFTTEQLLI